MAVWFRWRPDLWSGHAALVGASVVAVSAMMPFVPPLAGVILRDVVMIGLLGVGVPLLDLARRKEHWPDFGLTLDRWKRALLVNAVLAIALLALFLGRPHAELPKFDGETAARIVYILLAGVFEIVLFYAWQRTLFERAFGIIPSIVLAAAFYAFHHIGFQPEFGKLFLVGIIYASVVRLLGSVLAIYPFFWGVGACWDVLVQSRVVAPLDHAGPRSAVIALVFVAVLAAIRYGPRR